MFHHAPMRFVFLALSCLVLSACVRRSLDHGWMGSAEDVKASARVGKTTQASLDHDLGAPTLVSSFDPHQVYYVHYQTTSSISLLKPRMGEVTAFLLVFDKKDRLRHVETIDTKVHQMHVMDAEITPVDREYNEVSFEKVFRNLGQQGRGKKGL